MCGASTNGTLDLNRIGEPLFSAIPVPFQAPNLLVQPRFQPLDLVLRRVSVVPEQASPLSEDDFPLINLSRMNARVAGTLCQRLGPFNGFQDDLELVVLTILTAFLRHRSIPPQAHKYN